MKMRKLFAGIAAAATLLGGMALGATSAQADDAAGTPVTGEATFTFTAETAEQLTNANLKAYKIGDYVQYGSDENVAYGVVTNSANKNAVDSALKTAGVATTNDQDNLAAALNTGALDISTTRPWNSPDKTRKFANALESENELTNGTSVTFGTPTGSDENEYSATVSLPAGIYVFIDSAVATGSVTKAIPMIVASGTVNAEKKVLTNPTAAATVNMKNTNNPGKTKEVNKTSAAIGDTLTYTLTGSIANPAPTEFKFADKPGKGLTIKANSFQFFTEDANKTRRPESADNFHVALTDDFKGNGNATFDVKVNDPSTYAGKKIVVTFEAVINDEADVENGVVNELDNYGTSVQAPTTFGKFDFTKVDPDGKGIKDVTFQVKDGDTTLYFVKQDDGSYKKAASATTSGATADVKTGADGKLSFTGLDKTKTYTVTETARANGNYLDIKPSFTVSFRNGVAVLAKTTTSDPWGLVNITAKTVKNIKSITQLPLTGAAGTMLFTVVALLVAGAGVTIAIKSRQNAEA